MDVAYEPGELKAVAYKDDKKIGEAVMRTAGPPAPFASRPIAPSSPPRATISAMSSSKPSTPMATNVRSPTTSSSSRSTGPAEIAGVGNGNPMSLEPNQADHRKLFFGKAMLIVRAAEGEGGTLRIAATSDGLKSAETSATSRP